MAYGNDTTVFVEDTAGDQGATPPGQPWWLSPDVDIPAHSGTAFQGSNTVQIRVHAADEPFIDSRIVAEVYVGTPSLAMSPTVDTKRIDPGNLLFRPSNVAGTEPVADVAGGTLTFPWTPGSDPAQPDGPGHRCLVVRAFPEGVTPPSSPFTVVAERHEAQHNCEILMTTKMLAPMDEGGAGTRSDPRRRDKDSELWWEALKTTGPGGRGRRFVTWAFDPNPEERLPETILSQLERSKIERFGQELPLQSSVEVRGARGSEISPSDLLKRRGFGRRSGVGEGMWDRDLLIGAGQLLIGPRTSAEVVLRFDHSYLEPRMALVLHAAQWSEDGDPEGGMTIVAVAPVGR